MTARRDNAEAELKRRQLLAKRKELIELLPHLYGWKWYPWAREFLESTNRLNILTAANQIGKSVSNVRKMIHWATHKPLWPTLWPRSVPRTFWYLYPSYDVAMLELENKWKPEILPRGRMKDDPVYGWKILKIKSETVGISFNSGINCIFKYYSQKSANLQTGTVWALFADEETPEQHFDEIMLRLAGTEGYAHFVFTATLGQYMWYRAMEMRGTEHELFPDAWKRQISMYDCLFYDDGTPSGWTNERIRAIEQSCKSEAEVQRRVYGRFVKDEGKRYPAFDPAKNMIAPVEVDSTWMLYSAVDPGSGGVSSHPAAMIFVAVRPDCRLGYVFLGRRMDGVETTASDILTAYREVRGNLKMTMQFYDFAAKDFGIIAQRSGEAFTQADKRRDASIEMINTLFKNQMLYVFETDELQKLSTELQIAKVTETKTKAHDDFVDCLRYVALAIPWDWTYLQEVAALDGKPAPPPTPVTEKTAIQREIDERRSRFEPNTKNDQGWGEIGKEFAFWNEINGS